ncbi:MAG: hypothetical protein ACRDTM_01235 [Micromonosporaceae bacterium]
MELFKLSDVAYGEDAFARDLAALAGDRFHDLRPRPVWPVGAIALRRFPAEAERGRLRRWQDRRNAMLFVGWCVFVLVPPLLLTGLAAHYSELLRIAALAASALASAPLL